MSKFIYKILAITSILTLFFTINNNDVYARQFGFPGYQMVEETCWVTGEPILICRAEPDWNCVVGSQDTCSGS